MSANDFILARQHPEDTRQAFLSWLSLPSELRSPATLEAWCAEHGVSRSTCWRWRTDPVLQQEFVTHIRGQVLHRLPDVIETVIRRATEGSAKHAELTFKYVVPLLAFSGIGEDRQAEIEKLLGEIQSGELWRKLEITLRGHLARQGQPVPVEEAQIVGEGEGGEAEDEESRS